MFLKLDRIDIDIMCTNSSGLSDLFDLLDELQYLIDSDPTNRSEIQSVRILIYLAVQDVIKNPEAVEELDSYFAFNAYLTNILTSNNIYLSE